MCKHFVCPEVSRGVHDYLAYISRQNLHNEYKNAIHIKNKEAHCFMENDKEMFVKRELLNVQKCGIIGCGAVGATTAHTLLGSGLFSEIVLIDVNRKKAEGEAMDIGHGAPFVKPVNIYAGDYSDLRDAYLVIITAGANQMPGETRIDLAEKNVKIFQSIIPQITAHNRACILLIVSNPVDILTYVALKLSGFEPGRVIGSGTVLDTGRFKYLLGEHLGVDSRNVHALIIGEHGDSEVAVYSSANISGVDLDEFCRTCHKCTDHESMHRIYEEVKNSAYAIIERKGATFYAIARVVKRIAQALIRDEHAILTVSSLVDGHYGISGVCLGLPSVVGRNGVEQIIDTPLDEDELTLLTDSAKKLREVLDGLNIHNLSTKGV